MDRVTLDRKEMLLYDYKNALVNYKELLEYAETYGGKQYGCIRTRIGILKGTIATLEKCLIREFNVDVNEYRKKVFNYEVI